MTSPPRSANVRPVEWRGVFAGVPTQFDEDETLELGGIETQLERLVDCGVAGGAPVQTIELAQRIAGIGSETVRAPRLPLAGRAREVVELVVHEAIERRPTLEAVGRA